MQNRQVHSISVVVWRRQRRIETLTQGIRKANKLEKKVYVVPEDINKEIARLKLEAMGVKIDTLTDEQLKYLSSWEEGT